MMEMNKCFFELMRTFDFQVVSPGKPWTEKSHVVWMRDDMWLKISEAKIG
ncbi:putative cytochrome p450 [Rosellinia necatrix]|uniref:Putative cytochrome p450 n=1 Tax=Rosellinia necatrix TaxID=77044 RepID=A0A1S8A8K4_ROSNE|nr:putative cytochrome p450 [Rosellinia necatrix]